MTYFQDHWLLITGASSGIGRALALNAAERGAHVVLLARSGEKLAAVARQIAGFGVQAVWEACDVTNQAAVQDAAARLRGRVPRLDTVIVNAGTSGRSGPAADDAQEFRRILEVNLLGAHQCITAFLPLIPTGGKVVVMSSIAAYFGFPGAYAYSASKAALNTVAEGLRLMLYPRISVLLVCPGYVRTPMTADLALPGFMMLPAETAARRIMDAIAAGKTYLSFPRYLAVAAILARRLPLRLKAKLFSGDNSFPGVGPAFLLKGRK